MGYSRVLTPEPRAYARPTALREGADDGTDIANADLPHHPFFTLIGLSPSSPRPQYKSNLQ